MGGVCYERDVYIQVLPDMPDEEEKCYRSECLLGLNKVDFPTFHGAIKRFGYRIDLNAEHLKSIAPEIRLDLDKMKREPRGAFNIYYRDPQVIYKDGVYQVDKLLIMGWLLCKHADQYSKEEELWHVINPELQPTV